MRTLAQAMLVGSVLVWEPENRGVQWEDFFVMGDPIERRALHVYQTSLSREESILLQTFRAPLPTEPVETSADRGTQLRDVLWTLPILVRSRVIDLLVSEGLTGWATYPVIVRGREGELIDGYEGFYVTGRSVSTEPQTLVKFDPTTWGGSDFFSAGAHIFVTPRVRTAFRSANVRNVQLRPVAEEEAEFGWIAQENWRES